MKKRLFLFTGTHLTLDVWILASIVRLETQRFCQRNLTRDKDPCGRQFDQMTQAARSIVANIAEGSARWKTSPETELKLVDVARASLSELQTEFVFWLLFQRAVPWSKESPQAREILEVRLDRPNYGSDWLRDSSEHILQQREKFAPWLDAENDLDVANAILLLIGRVAHMLNNLLDANAEAAVEQEPVGGQIAWKRESIGAGDVPFCPLCGKSMKRQIAKKGPNAGKPFWGCAGYPECKGTRPF